MHLRHRQTDGQTDIVALARDVYILHLSRAKKHAVTYVYRLLTETLRKRYASYGTRIFCVFARFKWWTFQRFECVYLSR